MSIHQGFFVFSFAFYLSASGPVHSQSVAMMDGMSCVNEPSTQAIAYCNAALSKANELPLELRAKSHLKRGQSYQLLASAINKGDAKKLNTAELLFPILKLF